MRCRQFENYITDYIDGRLPGKLMLEMREHMDACDDCRRETDGMRAVRDLLRSMGSMPASQTFDYSLTARSQERWYVMVCEQMMDRPQRGRQTVTALAITAFALIASTVPFASPSADSGFNAYIAQQSLTGQAVSNQYLPVDTRRSADITVQLARGTPYPADEAAWRIIRFRIHHIANSNWPGVTEPRIANSGGGRMVSQAAFASFCGQ